MIKATYYRSRLRLKVAGHSGGRKGVDPVCAGVSALVLTAAANLAALAGQSQILEHRLDIREGYADLWCKPRARMAPVVMLILDALVTGLQLMQSHHPEKIELEIIK